MAPIGFSYGFDSISDLSTMKRTRSFSLTRSATLTALTKASAASFLSKATIALPQAVNSGSKNVQVYCWWNLNRRILHAVYSRQVGSTLDYAGTSSAAEVCN